MSIARSELDLGRERLSLAESALQKTREEKGLLLSGIEKFANLDPSTARRTSEAAAQAERGQDLSFQQAKLLKPFIENNERFRKEVEDSLVRRAERLGGDAVLGQGFGQRFNNLREQVSLDLKTVSEVAITVDGLEGGLDKLKTQLTEERDKDIDKILAKVTQLKQELRGVNDRERNRNSLNK